MHTTDRMPPHTSSPPSPTASLQVPATTVKRTTTKGSSAKQVEVTEPSSTAVGGVIGLALAAAAVVLVQAGGSSKPEPRAVTSLESKEEALELALQAVSASKVSRCNKLCHTKTWSDGQCYKSLAMLASSSDHVFG